MTARAKRRRKAQVFWAWKYPDGAWGHVGEWVNCKPVTRYSKSHGGWVEVRLVEVRRKGRRKA